MHSPVAKGESISVALPIMEEPVVLTSTDNKIRRNAINEDDWEHIPIALWMAGYLDLVRKIEKHETMITQFDKAREETIIWQKRARWVWEMLNGKMEEENAESKES